jgi:hypothetical protein
MFQLPGEELNRRLEELSLRIERVSLLIEDAMVDPSDVVSLDQSKYNDLILCMSKYGELLNSFQESTEDTVEEIRGTLGLEASTQETETALQILHRTLYSVLYAVSF